MNSEPQTNALIFNGLNAVTGDYLLPPLAADQVAALAQKRQISKREQDALKDKDFRARNPHAGVEEDARKLDRTGWGILLPAEEDAAPIMEALQPLLKLRQDQAGDRYKEFTRLKGYREDQTASDWLESCGMGPGSVNPEKVPYYLLLVGDPESIPYRFQYQLDVQYAVGRIFFDNLQDYASYAHSLVAAEKQAKLKPRVTLFGVANPNDPATQMSAQYLVDPLSQQLSSEQIRWLQEQNSTVKTNPPEWQIETITREDAKRAKLESLLGGSDAPALLFTASHGIAFPSGHRLQIPHQGALVCQDWPGVNAAQGEIREDWYLAGEHLDSSTNLIGSLAFFFACYGAGTPSVDDFAALSPAGDSSQSTVAAHNFVASLPKRMLSLPRGGAQAVVGHIERAWANSFFWGTAGSQIQVFQDCFVRLMRDGYPIGYAMEVFNNRYAEMSTLLSEEIRSIEEDMKRPNTVKLSGLWAANNDARNYVIVGDPAARLHIQSQDNDSLRPILDPVNIVSGLGVQAAPAIDIPSQPPSFGLPADSQSLDQLVQKTASKISEMLTQLISDDYTLEVITYRSEDRTPWARTLIRLDGSTNATLSDSAKSGDDAGLWKKHLDLVQQAQTSRIEMIKIILSEASQPKSDT